MNPRATTLFACRDCGTLIEFLGERPRKLERVCDECGGELRRCAETLDAHILKRIVRRPERFASLSSEHAR